MKEPGTFSYITTESACSVRIFNAVFRSNFNDNYNLAAYTFLRFIEAVIVSSTAILMCDDKDVIIFVTYDVYVGICIFLLQKILQLRCI